MSFIEIYLNFIIFVLGTVIGSFLNVCIYRIPVGLSIVKPRSRCGSCGHTLTALDLIPLVSWLMLKGKCRTCGAKIAIRYPLVELLEGVLFLIVFHFYGLSVVTPIFWIFVAFLTVVFFIDLDHKRIPNKLVIFGCVIGLLPIAYHVLYGYPLYYSNAIYEPLLGMVVPFAVMLSTALFSLVLFKKSGMGMGDVKVYLPIGLFLGWQLSLMSIWFSFFLGGGFGIFWIFVLRKSKNSSIPFAPFIVMGSLISLFWGKYLFILLFK